MMTVDEAIDLVVSRESRPFEDDWELVEAAEVLASEVAVMRGLGRRAVVIISNCIIKGMPVTQEVADVRNEILNTKR